MKFDLIILGGGSGGMACAVRAARHGAKVAVVEERYLGGTCVNLGCVPKKIMFNASMIADMMLKSSDYGFKPVAANLDWQTLVSKRDAYIEKLRKIYAKRFKDNKITYLAGKGAFIAPGMIEVAGKQYQAKHTVIATGGKPILPRELAGVEHAVNSDGFFKLNALPKKVAIIGGGYIGVELAGILNSLGAETHFLIRGECPLSRFDSMLGKTLLEIMYQQGIKVHVNHQVNNITLQTDKRKSIPCHNGEVITDLDTVIVAVGRAPRTADLNLTSVGVVMDERGLITVDRWQNTSTAGIYAIGDVTGSYALTPVAVAAGRKLADRLFGGQPDACLNDENVCSVIFSHPPIGTVGLSEADAVKKFGKEQIKCYETRFNPMFDALSDTITPTAMKLVTQGKQEKIVGLHIIGHNADEMLQGFGVAIQMGACKRDFDNTMAIHPTSSEELVTMT